MEKKVLNFLLFFQFIIISLVQTYTFSPEYVQHLSFLLLIVGYWVNPNQKK